MLSVPGFVIDERPVVDQHSARQPQDEPHKRLLSDVQVKSHAETSDPILEVRKNRRSLELLPANSFADRRSRPK